ncbi:hypothetical protein [Alcanivorax sp. 1008]|uniref:hypothetical protein n=1 Tax=Alcanivorax sp. 1008 TaxID=2816853 RepID=UPI001D9F44A8|nr:hypothetical protein [Alcanivorax sp. 1008]MCC1496312.1 hypothetical protein [Alcanivorax sp. 1008]
MHYLVPIILGVIFSFFTMFIIKWIIDKREHKNIENIRLLGIVVISSSGPLCIYLLRVYLENFDLDKDVYGIAFMIVVIGGLFTFWNVLKPYKDINKNKD